MNIEILGVIFMVGLLLLLVIFFGWYIGKVFLGEFIFVDWLFNLLDWFFYKLGGVDL